MFPQDIQKKVPHECAQCVGKRLVCFAHPSHNVTDEPNVNCRDCWISWLVARERGCQS